MLAKDILLDWQRNSEEDFDSDVWVYAHRQDLALRREEQAVRASEYADPTAIGSNEWYKKWGEVLSSARQSKGKDIIDVSHLIGVSPRVLRNIERGLVIGDEINGDFLSSYAMAIGEREKDSVWRNKMHAYDWHKEPKLIQKPTPWWKRAVSLIKFPSFSRNSQRVAVA